MHLAGRSRGIKVKVCSVPDCVTVALPKFSEIVSRCIDERFLHEQ